MTDDTNTDRRAALPPPLGAVATVAHLASRRRNDDILSSMTFVFGGVHYGTITISTPYVKGKPIVLYIVPRNAPDCGDPFAGPLDCLITDDTALASDFDVGLAR
jgi:hypothetical protein